MDTHNEEWRPSPLAPDFVRVSNLGRVKVIARLCESRSDIRPAQLKKEKIHNPWLGKNGYMSVAIQHKGKRKKYLLHRLIASAFCPNFDPSLTVNHIDGDKTNNNIDNLEWITKSKNTQHQWATGLVDLRGERHPSHKLTNQKVHELRELHKTGTKVADLAKMFNVSQSLCYFIVQNKKRIA